MSDPIDCLSDRPTATHLTECVVSPPVDQTVGGQYESVMFAALDVSDDDIAGQWYESWSQVSAVLSQLSGQLTVLIPSPPV